MRRWSTFLGVSLLAVPALAQGPATERLVTGMVFDSISGRALSDAVFYVLGRRDEHKSDSYGRFRVPGVDFQDTVLVVRRIGFVPLYVAVPASQSAIAVNLGTIQLKPVATELDRIAVEAEVVERYPQLTDFYRRKQAGRAGYFAVRDEIERMGVVRTTEVLARAPRVELDCPNGVLGDDRCVARSRRGREVRRVSPPGGFGGQRTATGVQIPADTSELAFGFDRCEMEVWVDGMRTSLRPDEVPLRWIAGIEVYNGLATTPAAFGAGRCGVVAIWTTRAGGE